MITTIASRLLGLSADLFGNPLSEEKDYRVHVIRTFAALKVLDNRGKSLVVLSSYLPCIVLAVS